MRKALAAFSLATLAGTIGVLGLAPSAQATPQPKHTVTFLDACAETSIVVANGWDRVAITVRAAEGDAVTIEGGQEATLTVAQTEPFAVEVKGFGDKWNKLAEHTWTRPAACEPYTKPAWECDRWTLNLVNPASLDAKPAKYTLKLEPVVENVKLLWTVKAGGSESLGLGKGVSARVKIGKGKWADYKWQAPEKGCQEPTPGPTTPTPNPEPSATPGASGGGPELPLTGAGTATVAGIGGALLLGGVGLAAIRRRRPTFKA